MVMVVVAGLIRRRRSSRWVQVENNRGRRRYGGLPRWHGGAVREARFLRKRIPHGLGIKQKREKRKTTRTRVTFECTQIIAEKQRKNGSPPCLLALCLREKERTQCFLVKN